MRSLGIIPARGGSRELPLKNIIELNGEPLITFTIRAALCSNLDRVIVSTDDEAIAEVACDSGAEVMMRPAELARHDTPTLPVLQHVAENLDERFDWVVTLQPTSPFRTSKHINEALEFFEQRPDADTLVSVTEVPHNMVPASLMTMENEYLRTCTSQKKLTTRRQEKPKLYARNGPAILILQANRLEISELYAGKVVPYFMDAICSVDIDDREDLEIAQCLYPLWQRSSGGPENPCEVIATHT